MHILSILCNPLKALFKSNHADSTPYIRYPEGARFLLAWMLRRSLEVNVFHCNAAPWLRDTWRFMGSYKWGYKSPNMGPTYNYP